MKPIILMISGKAGSGKDEIANIIQEEYNKSARVSFATPLKRIARNLFNWDNNKDLEGRRLLITIGQIIRKEIELIPIDMKMCLVNKDKEVIYTEEHINCTRYNLFEVYEKLTETFELSKNFWSQLASYKIIQHCHDNICPIIVITDWRFLDEYIYLKTLLESTLEIASMTTIRINRNGLTLINDRSETNLDEFEFDYMIDNNNTLEALRINTVDTVEEILEKGLRYEMHRNLIEFR